MLMSRQSRPWNPETDRELREIIREMRNFMSTLAELQATMDATKAEVARQTTIDASIKAALAAQTQMIADLGTQIAALQTAGAGAVTQDQLDALAQEATDTLTVAKANNDDLATAVPQNTPAAGTSPVNP